jgi:1,4-dihydroxy-2-naphthoyl-CoA synthase
MSEGLGPVLNELLLNARSDGVLTLTFNRPDARNALSSDLVLEFYDAPMALRIGLVTEVVITHDCCLAPTNSPTRWLRFHRL